MTKVALEVDCFTPAVSIEHHVRAAVLVAPGTGQVLIPLGRVLVYVCLCVGGCWRRCGKSSCRSTSRSMKRHRTEHASQGLWAAAPPNCRHREPRFPQQVPPAVDVGHGSTGDRRSVQSRTSSDHPRSPRLGAGVLVVAVAGAVAAPAAAAAATLAPTAAATVTATATATPTRRVAASAVWQAGPLFAHELVLPRGDEAALAGSAAPPRRRLVGLRPKAAAEALGRGRGRERRKGSARVRVRVRARARARPRARVKERARAKARGRKRT